MRARRGLAQGRRSAALPPGAGPGRASEAAGAGPGAGEAWLSWTPGHCAKAWPSVWLHGPAPARAATAEPTPTPGLGTRRRKQLQPGLDGESRARQGQSRRWEPRRPPAPARGWTCSVPRSPVCALRVPGRCVVFTFVALLLPPHTRPSDPPPPAQVCEERPPPGVLPAWCPVATAG